MSIQVEGKNGLRILGGKLSTNGPPVLFHGALAAATATAVGHYPWFATVSDHSLTQPPLHHVPCDAVQLLECISSTIRRICEEAHAQRRFGILQFFRIGHMFQFHSSHQDHKTDSHDAHDLSTSR